MNDCDLEEVKHLALQKFLELAEHPENWTSVPSYVGYLGTVYSYKLGKFRASFDVGWTGYVGVYSHSYHVSLDGQAVWSLYMSKAEESSSEPAVLAIKKIKKYFDDLECDRQKAQMLKAVQESCEKIQRALRNEELIKPAPNKEKKWHWFFGWRDS